MIDCLNHNSSISNTVKDCLNHNSSISNTVKLEIEEHLLLPIAEIEKRKRENLE